MPEPRTTPPALAERVASWVAAGIVSEEQAGRILAAESAVEGDVAAPSPRPRRTSPATEALGYVGGALVVVAAATITGRYWEALGTGGRLAIAFGSAAVLLAVGLAVRAGAGAPGARIRAVTWLASTATFALGMSVLTDATVTPTGELAAVVTAGATAVYGGLLWWRTRSVLQHAAVLAALVVAAGAAAALLPQDDGAVPGLAVWGVGAAWLLLGPGEVVARNPATVLGGVAVVLGSQIAAATRDWGVVLTLVAAAALVVAGVLGRDLVLLGVGSVAVLLGVPVAMERWFPDTLGAPLALLGAGLLLVGGALVTARQRRRRPERGPATLRPTLAAALAAAVAVAVTVAVVLLGSTPAGGPVTFQTGIAPHATVVTTVPG